MTGNTPSPSPSTICSQRQQPAFSTISDARGVFLASFGTGTMIFAGDNTYTGGTTICSCDAATPAMAAPAARSSHVLQWRHSRSRSDTYTFNGVISDDRQPGIRQRRPDGLEDRSHRDQQPEHHGQRRHAVGERLDHASSGTSESAQRSPAPAPWLNGHQWRHAVARQLDRHDRAQSELRRAGNYRRGAPGVPTDVTGAPGTATPGTLIAVGTGGAYARYALHRAQRDRQRQRYVFRADHTGTFG